jgi:hypothetical protein
LLAKRCELIRYVLCVWLSVFVFLPVLVQVYAIPTSNMLTVPYHAQELSTWCAPASVEMALEYISGQAVPQMTLASEMRTSKSGGTNVLMQQIPFDNRGYTRVQETQTDLNALKQLNAQGYVSILSIWSSTTHEYGHAVVVVGYDATGIIVNDPLKGPNMYIPNSILSDEWHNGWTFEIPYPKLKVHVSSSVHLSLSLSQAAVGTPVSVSASVSPVPPGGTLSIDLSQGTGGWAVLKSVHASTMFMSWTPSAPGTFAFRAAFQGYSDMSPDNITIYDSSESKPVSLVVQPILTSLFLSVLRNSMSIDAVTKTPGEVTVSGALSCFDSPGAVTVSMTGPNSYVAKTIMVRSDGSFTVLFYVSQVGTYVVSASFLGDLTHQPSQAAPRKLTVGLGWTTAIEIVSVVAAVCALLTLRHNWMEHRTRSSKAPRRL